MDWKGSPAGCILTMAVVVGVAEAWWPWVSQPLVPPWRPPQYPAQTRLVPGAPEAPPGSSQSMLRPPLRSSLLLQGSRVKPRRPPTTPRPSLFSIFTSLLDPLGLFSEDKEEEVRRVFLKEGKVSTVTTTEAPPPFVYFPEGGNGVCQDFAAGGGFNTYSFLSFLFSVANLIGHVRTSSVSESTLTI